MMLWRGIMLGVAVGGLTGVSFLLASHGFPFTAVSLPIFIAIIALWGYEEGRRSGARHARPRR